MKCWKQLLILLWQLIAVPRLLVAAEGKFPKDLPLPDANHSLETLTPNIRDVFVKNNSIYLIPQHDSYVIQSPFRADAKLGPDKFGKLADSRKIFLPTKLVNGPWDSIEVNDKGLLLLNGTNLRFSKLSLEGAFDAETDLIYDRILPPADSRGEPPQQEIAQVRAKFIKELNSSVGPRIAAIRRIPKSWKLGSNNSYLALSTLKNHPVLLVSCPDEDMGGCKIHRVCRVDNYRNEFSSVLSSVALHPEKKIILIGDRGSHKLHMLNFDSCFHIGYLGSVDLPSKLKALGGLFVDDNKRLWVSTLDRDDYNNSSVFYWDENQWIN